MEELVELVLMFWPCARQPRWRIGVHRHTKAHLAVVNSLVGGEHVNTQTHTHKHTQETGLMLLSSD